MELLIEEFCQQYGGSSRSIQDVVRRWQLDELDGLLSQLSSDRPHQLIGSAVIIGDALHRGSLLDDIPPQVKDAFTQLAGEKADTYAEMRTILRENIQSNKGDFLAQNDMRIIGFTNRLKGQIGENVFKEHVGAVASLADLGQEGWDVSVEKSDGVREYVQVKLYSRPGSVVEEMLKVKDKVVQGTLEGRDHEVVKHVYFAVPEDIKEGVQRLAEKHGVADMVYEKSIPISASQGAELVQEGMSNVGPDQLEHFFSELLCGAVAVGSLHALVNGFLWYKGSKEFSAAFAGAAANTAISITGVGAGLLAEVLFNAVTVAGAVGVGSRLFIGRMARSRWSFAEFLENSLAESRQRMIALKACN